MPPLPRPLRLACCLLPLLAGCSNGLARLEGMVTIDGENAPAGLAIEFAALDAGTSAYAQTDADGYYTAAVTFQQQGIPPGRYRVRLLPGSGPPAPQRLPGSRSTGGRQAKKTAGVSFPAAWYREIAQIEVKPGRNNRDINLSTTAADRVDKP